LNSYRTGPDGLTNFDTDVRTLLAQEDFDAAVEKVGPENSGAIGDRLLQLMDEALVRHYAADYEGSNAAIERAVRIIDDRYTKSISKAVFSLATNDRTLAYSPDLSERAFLHYYGALNYMALDDPVEAAVEARRLAYMLDREDTAGLRANEVSLRRSLRYFTAIVFEAAGEFNDAAVAYRHVWGADVELNLNQVGPGASEPGATSVDSEPVAPGLVLPSEIRPLAGFGDVVILVENGFVAHKVERGVTIPLFADDQRAMDSDDSAVQLAAAACIAEREFTDVPGYTGLATEADRPWTRGERGSCVVGDADALNLWADEISSSFPGLVSGSGRSRDRRETDGEDNEDDEDENDEEEGGDDGFYLMRVVWPEIRSTAPFLPPPGVSVDGEPGQPMTLTADLSGAVNDEYLEDITGILLKSVARAATKYLSYRGARDVFGDENETLGEIAGIAVNAAGFIMERADTRSWHVLPSSVTMIRLRLPEGSHSLTLQLDRESVVLADESTSLRSAALLGDDSSATVDLGSVDVQPGRIRVLSYRKWR